MDDKRELPYVLSVRVKGTGFTPYGKDYIKRDPMTNSHEKSEWLVKDIDTSFEDLRYFRIHNKRIALCEPKGAWDELYAMYSRTKGGVIDYALILDCVTQDKLLDAYLADERFRTAIIYSALCEDNVIPLRKELLKQAKERGVEVELPDVYGIFKSSAGIAYEDGSDKYDRSLDETLTQLELLSSDPSLVNDIPVYTPFDNGFELEAVFTSKEEALAAWEEKYHYAQINHNEIEFSVSDDPQEAGEEIDLITNIDAFVLGKLDEGKLEPLLFSGSLSPRDQDFLEETKYMYYICTDYDPVWDR